MQIIPNREALQRRRDEYRQAQQQSEAGLMVCAGGGCVASGATKVFAALKDELAAQERFVTLDYLVADGCGGITAVSGGCQGFCEKGPLVRVEPTGVLYTQVQPEDAPEIVAALVAGTVVERLLYRDPETDQTIPYEQDIPFYRNQKRVVLENCGRVDPEDIRASLAADGYQGLAQALTRTQEQVLEEIETANLRGRGGGGFPAGRKWRIAADTPAEQRYLICNGDEGDPGAFMDRSVMEGDPHRIIEGMLIAGYAIGASEGFIYVRAEYPLAVSRLQKAIDEAQACGLVGQGILGSDYNFQLHVKEGAGAFVCGEESALIASIEGERGMPRPKPPFPAESGLWQKPTVINNVETLANVPAILLRGSEWFRRIGPAHSPGTKTFALTGEVVNTGLVEVPMGLSLKEVVYDIGGGLRNGTAFKAVQIGGPSGGCLTADHLDLSLDFDSLQQVGAMIGSGGLVVMNDQTCIVEVARFFMNFTQSESCGKCVLCREGTRRMLEILQRIVDGRGELDDLSLLEEVGQAVGAGSLCGLGRTAPSPVLTTIQYFRPEYLEHVEDKRCAAGVCPGLRVYRITESACVGCSRCAAVCPVNAISGERKQPYSIDQEKCIKCGECAVVCKFGAVEEVA